MTREHPIFDQNVIALVWDFDKTLITEYMQVPLFRRFNADLNAFWLEVNGLEEFYRQRGIRVNRDTIYLNHLLTWVHRGPLRGLSNRILRDTGSELTFYPGLPQFFQTLRETFEHNRRYADFGIRIEHYIVSTGFAETIRGSAIAPYTEEIWGCEFIEHPAPPGYLENNESLALPEAPISQVAIALDNTSKTRYLFEINKGTNKFPEIGVHAKLDHDRRRVPFNQMIYIADGPSDIPAFSILNQSQGYTYAVYPKADRTALRQVEQLRRDGRIQMYGEADYSEGSQTWLWLMDCVQTIAEQIVGRRQEAIRKSVGTVPRHLN